MVKLLFTRSLRKQNAKTLVGCALIDAPSSDHPEHRKIYLIIKVFYFRATKTLKLSMSKEQETEPVDAFVNPIDKTKVTDTPGLLPYAHTAGGAVIRPEDKGQVRGNAMTAMYDQTDRQMEQLRQQMETLAKQAQSLHERMSISEMIYQADVPFQPIIHHVYHLYQRKSDGTELLSMIAPGEWGRTNPYQHLATVRLLGDHTWEVVAGGV